MIEVYLKTANKEELLFFEDRDKLLWWVEHIFQQKEQKLAGSFAERTSGVSKKRGRKPPFLLALLAPTVLDTS